MKYAYLIMVHNEPYILERLLKLIDDERNDIYIHVDKKWKDFDFEYFRKIVKKSGLIFTKRLDVSWGSYKQIECELTLFKEASKRKYRYYHLLSGVDMPLVNQNVMHKFFDNSNKEFVCFDRHDTILDGALERVKFYHFLVPWARNNNKIKKRLFGKIHFIQLTFEKFLKINRVKKCDLEFRKGANWVSITDEFVRYVLSKKGEVKKIFKHSYCADELFIQTLLYNSEFYKNVVSLKSDDYVSIKRFIDWNRGQPYTFRLDDYDLIMNSGCFFARKFSSKLDKEIIDKIYTKVAGKNDKS